MTDAGHASGSDVLRGSVNDDAKPVRDRAKPVRKDVKPARAIEKPGPRSDWGAEVVAESQPASDAPEPPRAAASGMDLHEAISVALDRNGKVKASVDDVGAARAVVWQQIGSFIPVVTANATRGEDYNQTLSNSRHLKNTLGSQLTLPLFTSGQRLFNWRSANSSLSAAEAESTRTRNEIALDLITAHINAASSSRVSQLIERNVETLQRLMVAVVAKKRLGFSSDTDQAQVMADLTSLKSQLANAKLSQVKAEEAVVSHVGTKFHTVPDLIKLEQALPSSVDEIVEYAMANNPAISAAEHQSNAARERSRAAISSLLPQVNLSATYDRDQAPYSKSIDYENWSVGVRASVPLLDVGAAGDVERTRYLASSASNRAIEARRTIELEVRQLVHEVQSGREQVALAQERVERRRQVAVSLEQQYKAGLVPLDSVLDRQRLLITSEVELEQVQVQRTVAIFRLLLVTGRFNGTTIALAGSD